MSFPKYEAYKDLGWKGWGKCKALGDGRSQTIALEAVRSQTQTLLIIYLVKR